jgi:hypothetical protein
MRFLCGRPLSERGEASQAALAQEIISREHGDGRDHHPRGMNVVVEAFEKIWCGNSCSWFRLNSRRNFIGIKSR